MAGSNRLGRPGSRSNLWRMAASHRAPGSVNPVPFRPGHQGAVLAGSVTIPANFQRQRYRLQGPTKAPGSVSQSDERSIADQPSDTGPNWHAGATRGRLPQDPAPQPAPRLVGGSHSA